MKYILLILLILSPFISLSQTQIGSASHDQFRLYEMSEKYQIVIESYRPITKSGHSDRRYNYTTSKSYFTDKENLYHQLINSFSSEKTIIRLDNGKIIIKKSGNLYKITLKGSQNYINENDVKELFDTK